MPKEEEQSKFSPCKPFKSFNSHNSLQLIRKDCPAPQFHDNSFLPSVIDQPAYCKPRNINLTEMTAAEFLVFFQKLTVLQLKSSQSSFSLTLTGDLTLIMALMPIIYLFNDTSLYSYYFLA